VDIMTLRRKVPREDHKAVRHTIARRSLTLLRNEDSLLPLDDTSSVLVITLSDGADPSVGGFFASALREQAPRARIQTRLLDDRSHEDEYERILSEASEFDVVVVPAFVYVRSWSGRINLADKNLRFLNDLLGGPTPVALISFGNPYIVIGIEQPEAYLAAYSASEASQAAAAEAIYGRSEISGKLPISIPGLYDFGEGLHLPQVWLPRDAPAAVGMSSDSLNRIDALIRSAIDDKAFPGAALAIVQGSDRVNQDAYGYFSYVMQWQLTTRSSFDLASLTKVFATTTAAMKLYDEGRLDLDARVTTYLPEFGQGGKQDVTIRHLLTHSAGLIPFRPFHQMGVTTREALLDSIMAEPLLYEPGTESRYSDLGMITMMLVTERITGRDFASFVREEIFEPLRMYDTGFRETGTPDPTVVPTELDDFFRNRLIQGEVHDEAAWILGGTSGHAGLFSTAEDLAKFAYMLINKGTVGGHQFIHPETVQLFTRVVNPDVSTRALGWDTKSPDGYTSAGLRFGPRSFGHTGFTGTSFWIDPDQELFVILLTNRVYPTRQNSKISQVRPAVADLAFGSIVGPPTLHLPELETTVY